MLWPWPPVIVRARPDARIRGPGIRPAATALATSMLAPPIPPRSRTVVTPASRFRFALFIALIAAKPALVSSFDSFSKSALPSNCRWTWTSIKPGCSVFPAPSISRAVFAPFGARVCAPTHSIPSVPKRTPWRLFTVRPSNTVTSATYVGSSITGIVSPAIWASPP
jgi:hypothetical protein